MPAERHPCLAARRRWRGTLAMYHRWRAPTPSGCPPGLFWLLGSLAQCRASGKGVKPTGACSAKQAGSCDKHPCLPASPCPLPLALSTPLRTLNLNSHPSAVTCPSRLHHILQPRLRSWHPHLLAEPGAQVCPCPYPVHTFRCSRRPHSPPTPAGTPAAPCGPAARR